MCLINIGISTCMRIIQLQPLLVYPIRTVYCTSTNARFLCPQVLHTAVSNGTAEPVVAMYTALIEDANGPLSFKVSALRAL